MTKAPSLEPRHAAKFYETEASLYSTVSSFLTEGLLQREPTVIVATPSHVTAIEQCLLARGVDLPLARHKGDFVVMDAEDTLGTFMIGGHPDRDLFDTNVGGVLERLARGRGHVRIRAYGEMVDVLWKQGRTEAAIELEILWNKLALKLSFSLLCGYSMGNFYKQAEQFNDVCSQHTHVFDPAATEAVFNSHSARFA